MDSTAQFLGLRRTCRNVEEATLSGHDVSSVRQSECGPGADLGGSLDLAVFGNRGGPEPRLKRVDRHQIACGHAYLGDV